MLDLERAAKVSGARFAFAYGTLARLERALVAFMLDLHTRERGYREVVPPYLVNRETLTGTGQLPKFEGDLFKTRLGERELFLIPTAEVPLTYLHADEILEAGTLPLQVRGLQPLLPLGGGLLRQGRPRPDPPAPVPQGGAREAHHRRDLDGRARGHDRRRRGGAEAAGPAPTAWCVLSTGDMGSNAAKTYDIEVWLPGQNGYREISSCSNCTDYQARRSNIRYRPEAKGKPRFVHTLNGSGLAVGRTAIALLENYQQRDGSVVVPEALRPYLGTDRITPEA